MDMYGFYTGKILDAYEYLGAHNSERGTVFRVFAPNAVKVSVIGDFNHWSETPMKQIYDGNFYECFCPLAQPGMRYKYRILQRDRRTLDHCDPYGYGMELRPQNASFIRNLHAYSFQDKHWMENRCTLIQKPCSIYEVHLGSWRTNPESENGWFSYRELADRLIPYVLENGYSYIEIMPLCEYPCDESWGYQAVSFYSPTSRYGEMDGLKYLVDQCHQHEIGVILDFAPVHFAVDDYGLAGFDGTPLYEYPHPDAAYNQWGSKNFAHSRGEVKTYLQSSVMYWLKEYHFDGIRVDAVSNLIYWQGNPERGVNQGAVSFLRYMNQEIKKILPEVLLIAEDSTAYPNVTKPVSEGGLGFDYKWDMGWMNDTLSYLQENPADRVRDAHRLTFSMDYFYSERFLLPLSHDEVVHGKASILQKMNGSGEDKFLQAKALYMYMYAHPGKKLNFMGNELGQLREWDEKREQDWGLAACPKHHDFQQFMIRLNQLYASCPALYEKDYEPEGFAWLDTAQSGHAVFSFLRKSRLQTILAVFNFSDQDLPDYALTLPARCRAVLLLDSSTLILCHEKSDFRLETSRKNRLSIPIGRFSARYYQIESLIS
ncbi:MAG: 1,4-alpha-glucan branching protein GlgB [Lachnospiraceae bacterium]|nr:1,4-alpha-glucan branching protein GlgB [Lachnospiraceae bacterium]